MDHGVGHSVERGLHPRLLGVIGQRPQAGSVACGHHRVVRGLAGVGYAEPAGRGLCSAGHVAHGSRLLGPCHHRLGGRSHAHHVPTRAATWAGRDRYGHLEFLRSLHPARPRTHRLERGHHRLHHFLRTEPRLLCTGLGGGGGYHGATGHATPAGGPAAGTGWYRSRFAQSRRAAGRCLALAGGPQSGLGQRQLVREHHLRQFHKRTGARRHRQGLSPLSAPSGRLRHSYRDGIAAVTLPPGSVETHA